jgi:hypothetical protein
MTGATDTTAELRHRIGPNGRFSLRLPSGEVSIRPVDGEVATVRELSGRSLADRFQITTGPESLELAVRQRFQISLQIGSFATGSGSADLLVDLPRGTSVAIDTASTDVSVAGLTGPGRYRTASGDLILSDIGGDLAIEGVSGDVRIDAVSEIEVQARTISGDLQVRAPRLSRAELGTTSGDLHLDAELRGNGPFSLKTISGDVMVVNRGGLQIEGQTITGEISSAVSHRTESGPGRRLLIVGDPQATLGFKSVSGDLSILEPRDAAPPLMPRPVSPEVPVMPELPTPPAPPSAPTGGQVERDADDDRESSRVEDARLEILRALERGDIDVQDATEQLASLEVR